MSTNSGQSKTSLRYDPFWSFVLNVILFVGMGLILQIVQRLFGPRSDWLGFILTSLVVGLLALLVLRWMRRRTNFANYASRMKQTRPPIVDALLLGALVTAFMLVFGFVYTSEVPASTQLVAIITLALTEGIWATVLRYIAIRYERRSVDQQLRSNL
jgi:uncharacterized membrane protein SirB2